MRETITNIVTIIVPLALGLWAGEIVLKFGGGSVIILLIAQKAAELCHKSWDIFNEGVELLALLGKEVCRFTEVLFGDLAPTLILIGIVCRLLFMLIDMLRKHGVVVFPQYPNGSAK